MIFYVNLPIGVMLAVAALKVVPADTRKPQMARPRPAAARFSRPRASPPSSMRSRRPAVGWTSAQTLLIGLGGVAGLAAFAALERRTEGRSSASSAWPTARSAAASS